MTERLGSLVPTTVAVELVLLLCGLPHMGWAELTLVALVLLLLIWPALALYAWARERGDL